MGPAQALAGETVSNSSLHRPEGVSAEVLRVPSNQHHKHRLVDSNPADGWKAEHVLEPGGRQEIVLSLAGDGATPIDRVAIQPRHWQPGAKLPKDVELAVSVTSPDDGFETVGRYELAAQDGFEFQVLRFEPRPARYVRLSILSLHEPGKPGLGEIVVLAAAPGEVAGEPPEREGAAQPAVAQERQGALVLAGARFEAPGSAAPAPSGQRYLLVELAYTNPHADRAFRIDLSELTVVVENGQYVYRADGATAELTPAFAQEHVLAPGETLAGTMAFLVPEETGDVALVHFTAEGPLLFDLAPEVDPPPPPQPLAGPTEAPPLRAVLYGAERLDDGSGAAPRVAVDLALTLLADEPLTAAPYDPEQYVVLRGADGQVFRPIQDEGLRRPLGTPELWANQPTRGELAFDLTAVETPPEGLMLEIHGGSEPIAFALPVDDLFPPPPVPETATDEKAAVVLGPPPSAPPELPQDEREVEIADAEKSVPVLVPPPTVGPPEPSTAADTDPQAATEPEAAPDSAEEPAAEADRGVTAEDLADAVEEKQGPATAEADTSEVVAREEDMSASPSVVVTMASGSLTVTLAEGVAEDGAAIRPTLTFSEDAENIYLVLRSDASTSARMRFFAEDVPYHDPADVYASGSVNVSAGERSYFDLRPPGGGFEPGRYRVEIEPEDAPAGSIDFAIEPKHPFALPEDEAEVPRGYNIALAALGGRVVSQSSQYDDGRWAAANLVDGVPFRLMDDDCESCGWSAGSDALPQEVVLGFHKGREAALAAVVLDTTTWQTLEYPDRMPKHVEVWASSKGPTEGFAQVIAARLRLEPARQVIPLPAGTRSHYLKLRMTDNFGGNSMQLGEVEVIEAHSAEDSILSDMPFNLARPELGGALVRFTSSKREPHLVRRLMDGVPAGPAWRSRGDDLPQDFTFAFRGDAPALVESVRLTLPADEDPATWPRRATLLVSEHHPLDGFEEIGTFELELRPGAQELPVGRETRFLKLRLLENAGGPYTALAEVEVLEGRRDGYVPLLLRDGLRPAERIGPRVGDEIAAADDDIPEAEPNDSLDQANSLPLDVFTRGVIDPLGEADVFALDQDVADAPTLTVSLAGQPNVRTSLVLLDAVGEELYRFDPGGRPAAEVMLTWKLKGDERFVRLTQPVASVVLVWDTSGSMEGRTEDLERAVRAYIERAPASQRLNLVRFSKDVEVLLGEFTTDKTRLLDALDGKFTPKGYTSFYDALKKAMELLDGVTGNKAVVVMSDGADTSSKLWHAEFWSDLEDQRVRLYAIGLGRQMREHIPVFGSSGERILGHLALATNGLSFLAEESSELETFYGRIADELERTSAYRLEPTIGVGHGRLDVVATGEQIARVAAPRVQLILDASGSMRERKRRVDGRLKIDVAKDVLSEVVRGLPEGAEVALRVYGRTIREGQPGDCRDTELLYPFEPLQREHLLSQIDHIEALGTTPLTFALEQAARDFGSASGERVIVLVTDGKEECGGDPAAAVARLIAEGLDVRVNVVGFALAEESVKATMAEVAELTGGRFFDASGGGDLITALQAAMAAPYTLEDASGQAVASGTTGGPPVEAPPGVFSLRVAAVGEPITVREVQILEGHATRVALKKAGQEVAVTVEGPVAIEEALWTRAVPGTPPPTAEETCAPQLPAIGEGDRMQRIQAKLAVLGYDPGPADNTFGRRTEAAIRAFEADGDRQVASGLPTAALEAVLDCALEEAGAWQKQVVARSSEHRLAVLAEYAGTDWCSSRVRLRYEVLDPGLFSSSDMPTLQQKIAAVVMAECPEAALISERGFVGDAPDPAYEAIHTLKQVE